MLNAKEIFTVKKEIWLHSQTQPALPAKITAIEDKIFWTNLPKEGSQVLVLLMDQPVKVGVSVSTGFFSADTKVAAIGTGKDKFYAFNLPEEFSQTQERKFIRVNHSETVLFKTDNLTARSALVNFSAGGLMVYLVPDLEKIMESGQDITLQLNIDKLPFELKVRPAWQKTYETIPFAGFEFVDITPRLQGALAMLAIKYNEEKN